MRRSVAWSFNASVFLLLTANFVFVMAAVCRQICSPDASCVQQPDSPASCQCLPGFTGNGVNCTDINECSSSPCGQNEICNNTAGSYECNCITGYQRSGNFCIDINECQQNLSSCPTKSRCYNTAGSFYCQCNFGYFLDSSVNLCKDRNECASEQQVCFTALSFCVNTEGSALCRCIMGYISTGESCQADPCTNMTCGTNATCKVYNQAGTEINVTATRDRHLFSEVEVQISYSGRCVCDTGLVGNASVACFSKRPNPCHTKPCAKNATCNVAINGIPQTQIAESEAFLNNALPSDEVTINCTCNPGFDGNGDAFCTGVCREPEYVGNQVYHFNPTPVGQTGYSTSLCSFNGQPLATAMCASFANEKDYTVRFYPVSLVPCINETLEGFTKQVDIPTLNATTFQQTVTTLDALTFNVTNLTEMDVASSVNFLVDVSNTTSFPITTISYERIVNIADHVATFLEQPAGQGTNNVFSQAVLTQSLSLYAYRVVIQESLTVTTTNIAAKVTVQTNPTEVRFQPSVLSNPNNFTSPQIQPVTIQIPLEALQQVQMQSTSGLRQKRQSETQNNTLRTVFLLHRTSALFPSSEQAKWVVSGNVGNNTVPSQISNLKDTVNITHNTVNSTAGKTQNDELQAQYVNQSCVFWDFSSNAWSNQGCCLDPTSNPPQCKCNHLTNFAMLVSIYSVPADVPLQIVTYVGCCISVVTLLITVILLLISKDIRTRRPMKVLMNICVNLAIVYVIFMVGIDQRLQETRCIASTLFLYYFLLSNWCWMAVYGHLLYKSIVKIFNVSWDNYLLKASIFAYGFPLVLTIINVVVNKVYEQNSNVAPVCGKDPPSSLAYTMLADNMCWLKGYAFYIGFLLPVACLLVFNIIMFIIVIASLTCKRKNIPSTSRKRTNTYNFAIALTIASTLGVVWFFGFFMMLSDNLQYLAAMSWIFTIVASLQGFSIFALTCIRQGDVNRIWWPPVRRFFRCGDRKESKVKKYNVNKSSSDGTAKTVADTKSRTEKSEEINEASFSLQAT